MINNKTLAALPIVISKYLIIRLSANNQEVLSCKQVKGISMSILTIMIVPIKIIKTCFNSTEVNKIA